MKGSRRAAHLIVLATALTMTQGCTERDAFDLASLGPDDVAVAAANPSSGELRLTQPIRLTFTRDVAPPTPDTAGARETAYDRGGDVALHPQLDGVWRWSAPNVVEFHPDSTYAPATTYTVTIAPRLASDHGLRFQGPTAFSFTSEPLRVTQVRLVPEIVPDRPRTHVIRGFIAFNVPVAADQLTRHLSLRKESGDAIAVSVQNTDTDPHHMFVSAPIQAEERDLPLIATISSKLREASGVATLGEDHTERTVLRSFRRLLVHRLSLERDPGAPIVAASIPLVCILHFSDDIDARALEQRLSIEPAVDGLRIDSFGREVRLRGAWAFGTRYSVQIDRELTSASGLRLEASFKRSAFLSELRPEVHISGQGHIVARRGERTIGIQSINTDTVTVEVDRIFPNNIVQFLQNGSLSRPAADVHNPSNRQVAWGHLPLHRLGTNERRFDIGTEVGADNTVTLTKLPLDTALPPDARGIFRLTVRKTDERRIGDARLVTLTDLGLIAKTTPEELIVAVVSIGAQEPLDGVRVRAVSYANQILATTTTDADGIAVFAALDPSDRPFVVVADQGDDAAFLSFGDTRIPTGDHDIGGIDVPATGYRAFVYADRDIFRPGDVAHLAWMTRDAVRAAPPSIPLTLRVDDPNGQTFLERKVTTGELGHADYRLDIPAWAPTGSYRAGLYLEDDVAIGATTLRVEDFMPDRMKVNLEILAGGKPIERAHPGDVLTAELQAMTLFGPPAIGRSATAELRLSRETPRLEQWSDYTFGDATTTYAPVTRTFSPTETDTAGHAAWRLEIPDLPALHGWLRAEVTVEVTELGGGRVIGDRRAVIVSPVDHLVGIARERGDAGGNSDYIEVERPIAFRTVLVDVDGNPARMSAQARVELVRRRWHNVLRRGARGRYRYASELVEESVFERPMSELRTGQEPLDAPMRFEITAPQHGAYRLIVEDPVHEARCSTIFRVYGSGHAPWSLASPERVEIRLDRDRYAAGDTVRAQIEAPFGGLLLLTLERERVFDHRWVRLDANSAVVHLPVETWMFPNAYIVATLLRRLEDIDARTPSRAFGAVPLHLDTGVTAWPIELKVPERIGGRDTLRIAYRITPAHDPDAVTRTTLTLAAVDEGILQVTDFATPSPLDFFCARRRLAVDSFDTWSLLLPEYSRLNARRPGGGQSDARRKNLNPIAVKRVQPVSFWSGIVDATQSWNTVEFPLPEFTGTLRIMAVGGNDARSFDASEASVIVRDPIVLTPNLPRVLAPGDVIDVPVQVYNGLPVSEGASASIDVGAALSGPLVFAPAGDDARRQSQAIELATDTEGVVEFRVEAANAIGKAVFECAARPGPVTSPNSAPATSVRTELAVRPARPLESRVVSGALEAGETIVRVLESNVFAGTHRVKIEVSPLPFAKAAVSLDYLLQYPYGCLEQTVSRAMPLLHFGALAGVLSPEAFAEDDGIDLVNIAIDRVAAMLLDDGGFAYWPGGNHATANPWATVYATHFLVEARRQQLVVPERVLERALRHVGDLARSSSHPGHRRWSHRDARSVRCYAVYVLALAGMPDRGAMEQLIGDALDRLSTGARCQLAGAIGLAGNTMRMRELLPATFAAGPRRRSTGYTWASPARDDAIALDVLATLLPDHHQIPTLVSRLFDEVENGRWRNTQENAWAIMALGKLARRTAESGGPLAGSITIDGEHVASIDTEGASVRRPDTAGSTVNIMLTSGGPAYYAIVDEGVPNRSDAPTPHSNGLSVHRELLDADGARLEPDQPITQGAIVIARVSLVATDGTVDNVIVTDLVPAGLEIENPRLSERNLPDWARSAKPLPVEYLDVRDDRLLVFTNATSSVREFYYGLRAVTRGSFVQPPIKAEAMYDERVAARSGGGRIRVGR